jgi:hypothetical protein
VFRIEQGDPKMDIEEVTRFRPGRFCPMPHVYGSSIAAPLLGAETAGGKLGLKVLNERTIANARID